ncbi:hypothetical protein GGI03_007543, partial [Coemansia sp. RSA 2337]
MSTSTHYPVTGSTRAFIYDGTLPEGEALKIPKIRGTRIAHLIDWVRDLEHLKDVAKITSVDNIDVTALDLGHKMGKGEVYFAWNKAGKRIIVVTRGDPAGSDM